MSHLTRFLACMLCLMLLNVASGFAHAEEKAGEKSLGTLVMPGVVPGDSAGGSESAKAVSSKEDRAKREDSAKQDVSEDKKQPASQPAAAAVKPPSDSAELKALIRVLEDDAARAKLLGDLRQYSGQPAAAPAAAPAPAPAAAPAAATPGAAIASGVAALGGVVNQTATVATDNVSLEFLDGFSNLINQFSQDTVDLLMVMAEIPQKLVTWWKGGGEIPTPDRAIQQLELLLGLFALFYITKFLGKRLMGSPANYINLEVSWALRLLPLVMGGMLWLGCFFFSSSLLVASLKQIAGTDRRIALALIEALTISGGISWLRLVFLPRLSQRQEKHSRRLNRLLDVALALLIYGTIGVQLLAAEGVAIGVRRMALSLSYLLAAGLLVMIAVLSRTQVQAWLRQSAAHHPNSQWAKIQGAIAALWVPLIAVGMAMAYGHWLLTRQEHNSWLLIALASLVVAVIVVRHGLALINLVMARLVRMITAMDQQGLGLSSRVKFYSSVFGSLIKALFLIVIFSSLLSIWQIKGVNWLDSNSGQYLVQRVISLLLITLFSVVMWELLNWLLHRFIHQATHADGIPNPRLQTLYRLIRTVVSMAFGALLVLMILSEMGVNIAPLLAGAGMIGVAVGFGAQSLVKDVLNGINMLIEDSVSLGDLVDLAGQSGTVEDLTLRSLKLRDVSGCVVTIPLGSITTIKNWSRDYGHQVLEVGVSHQADLQKVEQVLKTVSDSLLKDPELQESILEPADFWGVDRIDDKLVYVKLRIKTVPMKRWAVARAFYLKAKTALDKAGIAMTPPQP
jgi:small conductance mechanosensitive channel